MDDEKSQRELLRCYTYLSPSGRSLLFPPSSFPIRRRDDADVTKLLDSTDSSETDEMNETGNRMYNSDYTALKLVHIYLECNLLSYVYTSIFYICIIMAYFIQNGFLTLFF